MTTTRGDIRTDEVGRGRRVQKKGAGGFQRPKGVSGGILIPTYNKKPNQYIPEYNKKPNQYITKNPASIKGGVNHIIF